MGNPQLLMQIHDELIYEVAVGPDCVGPDGENRSEFKLKKIVQEVLVFKLKTVIITSFYLLFHSF